MYEGIAVCGCSNSGPVCRRGQELFQCVAAWYEVINAPGFLYQPLDVREEWLECYEQARENYFQHIGYAAAEVC